jgi:hypothetical protein
MSKRWEVRMIEVIKDAIEKIDFESEMAEKRITNLSRLCDTIRKVANIEAKIKDYDDSAKLTPSEIRFMREYLASLDVKDKE